MAQANWHTKVTITEMKRQCGILERLLEQQTREAAESLGSGT